MSPRKTLAELEAQESISMGQKKLDLTVRGDLFVDMRELSTHPMRPMLDHQMTCDAIYTCPMSDRWWIFDAEWVGDLPKGFHSCDLDRHPPRYKPRSFTEGINGFALPLSEPFRKQVTNNGGTK